jgi:hypothetical protein
MPTLADLRSRTVASRPIHSQLSSGDEAIVVDQRSRLRPAQIVEQKLRRALLRSRQTRDAADPPSQIGS